MAHSDTFQEKLAHWRKHGMNVTYQGGQDQFHGDTLNQRNEAELEGARRDGRELRPVDKNGEAYTGYGAVGKTNSDGTMRSI